MQKIVDWCALGSYKEDGCELVCVGVAVNEYWVRQGRIGIDELREVEETRVCVDLLWKNRFGLVCVDVDVFDY